MILVKKHEGVIAMADADLLGKEFEEGEYYLKVSEHFYGGAETSQEDVVQLMKDADNLNLVGKEVIGIALEEGFINEEDVITIKGVPHAQIYRILEG